MMRVLLLGLAWFGSVGCISSSQLREPEVARRTGPAHDQEVVRVVALSATCGAVSEYIEAGASRSQSRPDREGKCNSDITGGVDALVRSSLEFQGLTVIDSERLNATTFARKEALSRMRDQTSKVTEIQGSRFLDATPRMRARILAELGAEGLLETRIWVGSASLYSGRRDVTVQIRMVHVAMDELMWAARCTVDSVNYENDGPVMRAARCAADQALQKNAPGATTPEAPRTAPRTENR